MPVPIKVIHLTNQNDPVIIAAKRKIILPDGKTEDVELSCIANIEKDAKKIIKAAEIMATTPVPSDEIYTFSSQNKRFINSKFPYTFVPGFTDLTLAFLPPKSIFPAIAQDISACGRQGVFAIIKKWENDVLVTPGSMIQETTVEQGPLGLAIQLIFTNHFPTLFTSANHATNSGLHLFVAKNLSASQCNKDEVLQLQHRVICEGPKSNADAKSKSSSSASTATATTNSNDNSDTQKAYIKNLMKPIVNEDNRFDSVMESINRKDYSQALRRIAALKLDLHEPACKLATILLNHKEILGIKINSRASITYKQRTALHLAAVQNNKNLYELLKSHKADLTLKDDDGKTAADLKTQPSSASAITASSNASQFFATTAGEIGSETQKASTIKQNTLTH